ncbi:hypothetical protein K525DRAFT_199783 [Schizophyllum commune Loenen D]|nr:hypothetical protein K525DRAFT_199783 [Schizophyllum commune Loenen D]
MAPGRLAAREERKRKKREAADARRSVNDGLLASIHEAGSSLYELVIHTSDPKNKRGDARWLGLFGGRASSVRHILDLWTGRGATPAVKEEVSDWAVDHTVGLVRAEVRALSTSGVYHGSKVSIDSHFLGRFNLSRIHAHFTSLAGVSLRVFKAFATSPRHLKPGILGVARAARKTLIVTNTMLQLLGEYSYANNLGKKALGLYLYASGSQRQSIEVMSHIGISESYSGIIGKGGAPRQYTTKGVDGAGTQVKSYFTRPGTLRTLSESMRAAARAVASTGIYATVYDNINMVFRAAEQVVGRTDAQENGTCATIWPLHNATAEDMRVDDLQKAFDSAAPLALDDILHTANEAALFRDCLVHTILRVVVVYGGPGLKKYAQDVNATQPKTSHQIAVHQTPIHPLPAMEIDESTILGNGEVIEATIEELQVKTQEWFNKQVLIFAGDQLSQARIRALVNIRAGQEAGLAGYFWGAWMPGLFHGKIADAHGLLFTHFGKPNSGARNPGSLWFHNTRLHRLPITLTSLPNYRTCRDLIFVSLYARILHCLLLVSGAASLDEYVQNLSGFAQLKADAEKVFDEYANTRQVDDLRSRRYAEATAAENAAMLAAAEAGTSYVASDARPRPTQGDMVFENAMLFMRDALISREYTDAIKAGDSGRILLVLKAWALSFRGNGRTKYAHEMLHIIHNIEKVWPPRLARIITDNWLVNPTGKKNAFVEVDLMQEHLNFWIKIFYRAHGSNSSWEWLGVVAPCANVLRQLAKTMNSVLGAPSQGTRHAPADLSTDISELMKSLDEHDVYRLTPGRVLDDDDEPAKDVIGAGLQMLTDNTTNPLDEYNASFARLQRRRRRIPLVGHLPQQHVTGAVATPSTPEPMDTSDALPGPGTNSDSDTTESDTELDSEGSEAEFERVLADDEEPTLQVIEEEDVALDLDDLDLEEEDDEGDEEDVENVDDEMVSEID